ncbi:MAG: YcjF family protein [Bacilli bacterium]
MNNKRNKFWIMIGIGVLIIILMIVLSSILTLGEKLRNIHPYVEYAFYVLSAVLVYFLIINPVCTIAFAPTFSVITVLDRDSKKSFKTYKKVAKNIIANDMVNGEEASELMNAMKDKEKLRVQINEVFDKTIKKDINKIIVNNAKTVMISTAISQNGRFDMLTVLVVNLKMIKEIVACCGFRPSYAKLGKLSANVLSTALIAEGLEGLDFNDIFPTSTANMLSEVPLVKPIASSVIQGISNALLTIRIGVVTRRYLFTEYKDISKDLIRKQSIKESIKILPGVVKAGLLFFPEKIRNMFTKKVSDEEVEL